MYDQLLRLTACLLAVKFEQENSNVLKYNKVVGVTSHMQYTFWNKFTSTCLKSGFKIVYTQLGCVLLSAIQDKEMRVWIDQSKKAMVSVIGS